MSFGFGRDGADYHLATASEIHHVEGIKTLLANFGIKELQILMQPDIITKIMLINSRNNREFIL